MNTPQLNLRLLLGLGLGIVLTGTAVHFVHGWQMGRHAREQLARADAAREDQDAAEQLAALGRYLEFNPGDSAARIRHGLLLAEQATTPQARRRALQVLTLALVRSPSAHDARATAAHLALQAGEPEEAVRLLAPALAQQPDRADWHELHARTLLALDREADAAAALERVLELRPADVSATSRLAELYQTRLRRAPRADEVLDRLVKQAADRPAALVVRARFRARHGRGKEAVADAEQAAKLAPRDLPARVAWAELAEAIGDEDTAAVQWRVARDLAPSRPELTLGLARALRDRDEAGRVLEDGLKHVPNQPALLVALAEVRCDQNRPKDAEALRERLPVEAKAASLYVSGLIELSRGRPLAAARLIAEGVKLDTLPPDLEARALLALCRCYADRGAREERLQAARRAVELADTTAGRRELAEAALEAGLHDEVVPLLRDLADRPRPPAGTRPLLARALVEANAAAPPADRRWDECKKALERATKDAPTEVAVLRARVLELRGQSAEARAALDEAVKKWPDATEPWLALAGLRARGGDPSGAAETLRTADARLSGRAGWLMARAAALGANRLLQAAAKLSADDRDRVEAYAATLYLQQGRIAELERVSEALLKRHPDDAATRLLLIDAKLRQGDADAVQPHVEALKRREAENGAWWRWAEAERSLLLGKPADAARLADEAHQRQPDWPRPVLVQARLADRAGRSAVALERYEKVLELGDWSAESVGRAVALLAEAGRYRDADSVLERAQRRGAFGVELLRPAAVVAVRAGRPERARQLARQAVPEGTRSYRDLVWLANVLEAAGEPGGAERAVEAALKLAPDATVPWLTLARLRKHDRRPQDAEQALRDMLAAVPEARRASAEAQGHEVMGRFAEAEAAWRRILRDRPRDAEATRLLADLLVRIHAPAAEQALRDLLAEGSPASTDERPALRRQLALVITDPAQPRDRTAEALALLAANREEGETDADRRAEALVRARRDDEREASLKALEERGGVVRPEERLRLAWAYDAAGKWAKAREVLLGLLTADDDNPAYLSALVDGLLRQKKPAEASLWLPRLKAVEPASERVKELERRARGE